MAEATVGSWVTTTMVEPRRSFIVRSSSTAASRPTASSWLVGSSTKQQAWARRNADGERHQLLLASGENSDLARSASDPRSSWWSTAAGSWTGCFARRAPSCANQTFCSPGRVGKQVRPGILKHDAYLCRTEKPQFSG